MSRETAVSLSVNGFKQKLQRDFLGMLSFVVLQEEESWSLFNLHESINYYPTVVRVSYSTSPWNINIHIRQPYMIAY